MIQPRNVTSKSIRTEIKSKRKLKAKVPARKSESIRGASAVAPGWTKATVQEQTANSKAVLLAKRAMPQALWMQSLAVDADRPTTPQRKKMIDGMQRRLAFGCCQQMENSDI